ncbi:carbohydrate ABC transporter permease [Paramicrobacterium agarici]|uniref:Carbohydrate ABC transporter membrane protein 2 (CUT1 family) n=1 Tax=Paramicrobacterium agarici TaxID=630514 RepID=A0A2A9DUS4_9MICO|nr:carbohydrate ABC transporter permease [Microbacterium agarici]PFG30101.1 carbohydrate ABC transporter membrane protein 2 (CUT1 family) [Microbacterium agarici]TQO23108.1 carbohydrate ABC transporter membrane protein 2 (CUT1 family) [Microbacterium agarici]
MASTMLLTTGRSTTRRTKPMRKRAGSAALTFITWVLTVGMFFPIAWMVFTAFKTEKAAATNPPTFITQLTLENFEAVFDRGFLVYLTNSFTASVVSTLIVMVLAIPAAYGLSVRPLIRSTDALFFFISTKFMPLAAIVIPIYLLLQNMGLLDNISALSILYVGMNLPLAIWMMRSFLSEVPGEIIEAAQVDGASFWTELVRIVMPIVAPGMAAAALICFIFAWNEYFLANLLTSTVARTTPPFLGSFVSGRGQFLAVLSAAATLAVLPVVIAGWIAQKRLVRGLAMGAIK